ncbi:hypothetical protein CXF86_19075 [Shewanella sp. GutCb]|uniref:hypothetical protein n=1 Tax=Shewanella sp. GutCb TaxID=2058315 RepID=UPI000C7A5180|nr:hypothetical protein [Shewanella sp. GutCb]PKG73154.1 hypothetical protein CXF86_19075 [Shewanella sp. GutCb]
MTHTMANKITIDGSCALSADQAPAQQLQQGDVLHPDSPLHYLLPLCRPQQRQLFKKSTNGADITLQHRSAKHVDFSQVVFSHDLTQPLIQRLIIHIRVSSHEQQSPYLIDFREYLNVGGLWLICTDAEQHFVWKHTHKRGI